MFYKIGTIAEFEKIKNKLPDIVREKIHIIVSGLSKEYGEFRSVQTADGGFVLFGDNAEALTEIRKIISIDKKMPEWVESIGAEYLHAIFLRHNEMAISLILKKEFAPEKLIDELED